MGKGEVRGHYFWRGGKRFWRGRHKRRVEARAAKSKAVEQKRMEILAKLSEAAMSDFSNKSVWDALNKACGKAARKLRKQLVIPTPTKDERAAAIATLGNNVLPAAKAGNEANRGLPLAYDDIIEALKNPDFQDGFSIASHRDKSSGEFVLAENGTMVAFSGTEVQLTANVVKINGKKEFALAATPEQLADLEEWVAEMSELYPLNTIHFGGWLNKKKRPPYYEINVSLAYEDLLEGWRAGVSNNQDSVFVLGAYRELNTGGSGERHWSPKRKRVPQ